MSNKLEKKWNGEDLVFFDLEGVTTCAIFLSNGVTGIEQQLQELHEVENEFAPAHEYIVSIDAEGAIWVYFPEYENGEWTGEHGDAVHAGDTCKLFLEEQGEDVFIQFVEQQHRSFMSAKMKRFLLSKVE